MTLVYVAVGVVAVLLGVLIATKMKKGSNGVVASMDGSTCCAEEKAPEVVGSVSESSCVCAACPQDCTNCEECKVDAPQTNA
ncbi:MAG: hypothetical protein WC757_00855 [Candidatus Paceibacterota bacterium]|jgi:hypothetical protein